MSSNNEFDAEPMSTEMLEDIRDGSQSHLILIRKVSRYKIHDCIKQGQWECKGMLLSTQNMGKGLYKIFKNDGNDISQVFPILGEP